MVNSRLYSDSQAERQWRLLIKDDGTVLLSIKDKTKKVPVDPIVAKIISIMTVAANGQNVSEANLNGLVELLADEPEY